MMYKKKMKSGGMKPVSASKKKSLGKLPKAVRNEMGYAKMGLEKKPGGGSMMARPMMNKMLPTLQEGADLVDVVEDRMSMSMESPMDMMKKGGAKKMELPKRGMRMGGHVKRKKKGMMKNKKKSK